METVTTVKPIYEYNLVNWTDIQDHLPLLMESARGNCMEIGVRGGVSTSALLYGLEEHGGHLWSVDINQCQGFEHPNWTFIQADSTKEQERINALIPAELELLFVDGDHTYEGALSDLLSFGHRAKKILIHDVDCPDTFPGVRRAMEEYAAKVGCGHSTFHGSYGMGMIERPQRIVKALSITGWMTEGELNWLAKQASLHDVVVEVGCYQGRSTRAMGDNARGIVYAVDDWKGLRTVDETWWTNDTPQQERETLFEIFQRNIGDLIPTKVRVVRMDHSEVSAVAFAPAEMPADMVFIDGSHDYQSVKRDIQTWLPLLRTGGLMCGHDSNQGDVMQAVNELLPGAKSGEVGLIWTWNKP